MVCTCKTMVYDIYETDDTYETVIKGDIYMHMYDTVANNE